jgi:creatinine amidohydrolase
MRPAIAALLALASLAASAIASAQPAKPVFLEDLTWSEVREATKSGRTTVIVPIGGTEQSGPYIALGKHNARVRLLAGRIAESLGNALVAPVIAYVPEGQVSPPTGHMRFPGTITIPEGAFEQTLESAGRGFRLHGFRDVVFIGDHGGYQKSLKKAADTLNREWAATSIRAHALEEYYRAASVDFGEMLKGKGFAAAEIGNHAGAADTSLALATDPALVRADRMKAPNMGKADGVEGDPRRASAELGRAGLDLIVAKSVEAIRKATARR